MTDLFLLAGVLAPVNHFSSIARWMPTGLLEAGSGIKTVRVVTFTALPVPR
ncbi:hypothetical protein [Mycobacterium sp.]|uniref:hypothetical protein n=1 Tax=Mycobacterium sp. TaxID=1785 RepID=UPI003BAC926B